VPQLGLLVGTWALLVLGLLPERTLGRSRGFAGAAALLVWTGSHGVRLRRRHLRRRWKQPLVEPRLARARGVRRRRRDYAPRAALLVVIAARGVKPAVVRAALLLAGATALVAGYGVVVAFAAN